MGLPSSLPWPAPSVVVWTASAETICLEKAVEGPGPLLEVECGSYCKWTTFLRWVGLGQPCFDPQCGRQFNAMRRDLTVPIAREPHGSRVAKSWASKRKERKKEGDRGFI